MAACLSICALPRLVIGVLLLLCMRACVVAVRLLLLCACGCWKSNSWHHHVAGLFGGACSIITIIIMVMITIVLVTYKYAPSLPGALAALPCKRCGACGHMTALPRHSVRPLGPTAGSARKEGGSSSRWVPPAAPPADCLQATDCKAASSLGYLGRGTHDLRVGASLIVNVMQGPKLEVYAPRAQHAAAACTWHALGGGGVARCWLQ